jgi:uncharacterized membrane protein
MTKINKVLESEWFIIGAWVALTLIGYGFAYDFDGILVLAIILGTGVIALVFTYRAGQRSRNSAVRFWINRALLNNSAANLEFYVHTCGEEKAEMRMNLAWKDQYRPEDDEWNHL